MDPMMQISQYKLDQLRNEAAFLEKWYRDDIQRLLVACKNALWHLTPNHDEGEASLRTDELLSYIRNAIVKAEDRP